MMGSEKLGKYYIEEKFSLKWPSTSIRKLDKNGIILYKLPYTNKYVYYPVEIAHYALGNFEMFLDTNDKRYKDAFLKQTNWLVKNIVDKGDFGVWEHHYTLPYYNFNRIPWVHGMAQGLAISALLRAYQLTNNNVYLETAQKAYGAFERNIEDGGVQFIDEQGNIWLEEYAIFPPPHILNGFIFALFGIYDFYYTTKEKRAFALFNEGIKTLEENLYLYDNGYWSLYNLIHKYPATKSYHKLHINQLKVLYELTGKDIFSEYGERWEKYMNKSMNIFRASLRRMVVHWKRYGIKTLKIYLMRKKWLKE